MRNGVLITGGSGYLGRGLTERLLAEGCERICIFSRNEFNQAAMRQAFDNDPRLRWFIGDIRDCSRLERAMGSVNLVIHAAALKRIEVGEYDPEEMAKTNVLGTINVVEAARRSHVEKVLLVSSDKAFEPVSPYGQSKAMAESIVLRAQEPLHGPRFAVVRYGNVVGSTGSVIPKWREQISRGVGISITDPRCTRFWMSRFEAAELVINTLLSMKGGERAIPKLPAFRLGDLALAMGQERWLAGGLEPWEKLHESMEAGNCSETARRMSVEELRERLAEVPA